MKLLNQKSMLVSIYLISIVIANIIITIFGPSATVITAFLLIGLDLTARDKLHELWHNNKLLIKMIALIFAGSLLSFLVNRKSLQIAAASFVAFLFAGLVDFASYSFLYKKKWQIKVNGSNIFSALVDSIIFPTLAFGIFMPLIILGQFIAKTAGGAIWAFVLGRIKSK